MLLCCCSYNRRTEFIVDALQVFKNCEIFNEDDSAVGEAGHNLKSFFFERYPQLVGDLPAFAYEKHDDVVKAPESAPAP